MASLFELDLARFSEVVDLQGNDSVVDPRVFMASMVNPAAAGSVLKFAFPGFVQHRGAVLLDFAFDIEAVDTWFEHLNDPVRVEQVVNHVHLWDVLAPSAHLEAEASLLLAPLAACWTAALAIAFPRRIFNVLAIPEGDYGPELTLHSQI